MEKIKENLAFFWYIKNVSFRVLKISQILLVLRTREITDISNTFDEICLVFTSKSYISSINLTHLYHQAVISSEM